MEKKVKITMYYELSDTVGLDWKAVQYNMDMYIMTLEQMHA